MRFQNGGEDGVNVVYSDAIMTDRNWNVERVRHLSWIRKQLTEDWTSAQRALKEYVRLRVIQPKHTTTDDFLFFVLRFISNEGDSVEFRAP